MLNQILGSIHEIQFFSEDDNYFVYCVVETWLRFWIHLIQMSTENNIQEANLPLFIKKI